MNENILTDINFMSARIGLEDWNPDGNLKYLLKTDTRSSCLKAFRLNHTAYIVRFDDRGTCKN